MHCVCLAGCVRLPHNFTGYSVKFWPSTFYEMCRMPFVIQALQLINWTEVITNRQNPSMYVCTSLPEIVYALTLHCCNLFDYVLVLRYCLPSVVLCDATH